MNKTTWLNDHDMTVLTTTCPPGEHWAFCVLCSE